MIKVDIIFGVHLQQVNAEIIIALSHSCHLSSLIGSNFIVLHIGSGDGVKEFLDTDDLGSFYGRQVH